MKKFVGASAASFLASPKIAVAVFVLIGLAAFIISHTGTDATPVILLPLGLLIINLGAAILVNPRFRTDLPLLLFHLALLALVSCFTIGRLTYLEGRAFLPQGELFSGEFETRRNGPLHGDGFRSLRFMNAELAEQYPKAGDYRHTYNGVVWIDDAGRPQMAEIGDDKPLLLNGYRIFTSSNRGVSPILAWYPRNGAPAEKGTVLLRYALGNVFENAVSWKLPDGSEVWLGLEAALSNVSHSQGERVNMGVKAFEHQLIFRVGNDRYSLKPGDSIDLPGGRLHYEKLIPWMGYRVAYDRTLPWIVGAIGLAIVSLIWFYVRQVFLCPIQEVDG